MATLLFKFVFYDNASPQVVLTSTELTGGDAPTVNISTTAIADGTVASAVSGGALTYDTYTKSWGYRLASADLATYLYIGMATTTYATASPASVHALGMVVPDVLPSTLATVTALATAQTDLDTLTGSDGATLAASQPNYAPATPAQVATELATYDAPTKAELDSGLASLNDIAATDVWAAATRTLTQIAASLTAASTTGDLAAYRGDTISQPITGIGNIADRVNVWLTIKSDPDDADADAVIQVDESAGLLTAHGSAATAGNGSLAVTDESAGDLLLTIAAAETAEIEPGSYYYDIQIQTATQIYTIPGGQYVFSPDVTRRTS